MLSKKLLSFWLFVTLPILLMAQVTTSSITGKVSSSDGKVLEGATISAVHQPSGSRYSSVSGKQGYFTIPNMKVGGPYTIVISYMGMQSETFTNIFLQLGESSVINPVLATNTTVLQDVLVNAKKSVEKIKNGPSLQISQTQLTLLPTITRNLYDFARLLPEAQARYNSDGTTAGISFAGQSNKYNQFSIDGVNASDVYGLTSSGTNGGQAGINPFPFEAIDQVQVILAPYDVTQSGFTGGGVNAVTKSGTNMVHGSIFGFNQNQHLMGSGPSHTSLANFHDWTFGASLGGPIVKDKLFYFVTYEGERRSQSIDYQPGSASSNISVDSLEKLSTYLKSTSSTKSWSYDPGAYNGINKTRDADEFFIRLDWNIDSKNKLTIRDNYNYGRAFIISDANSYATFFNDGYYFISKGNVFSAELTSNISNIFSNDLRASYNHINDHREVPGAAFPSVTIKDNSGTYYFGPDYSSIKNSLKQDIFTLTDNFNIYLGAHKITVGTNNEFYNTNNLFIQDANSAYTYSSLNSFYKNGTPSAYYYYSPTSTGGDGSAKMHAALFSVYAQDAFDVNSRFKLTYGLRADIPVFFNKPGTNSAFNNWADSLSSIYGSAYNVASNWVPRTAILLSPRIGFNWDVKGDKSTVLRGGVGIFTGRVPFVWISNQYSGTGVLLNRYTASSTDLKSITFNPDMASLHSGTATGKNEIDVTSKHFKYPRTLRLSMAIDQKLPFGILGTLEAIYTKTLDNISYRDLNLAPSKTTVLVDQANGVSRPFYGSKINTTAYSNVVLLENTHKGYAYNVSASLRKEFDNGWFTSLSYSLGHSKSMNDGTSSTAMSNYRYAYNTNGLGNLDLARSNYDPGSSLKAYVSKKFVYGKFYSNVGLVYNGTSGQTLSYVYIGDLNGDDGSSTSSVSTSGGADLIYLPTSSAQFSSYTSNGTTYTPDMQYQLFQQYAQSSRYLRKHLGQNTVRNGDRLPWENRFDLKFAQGFSINKYHRIEITIDIFNVSNMLNSNWGKSYYASSQEVTPIKVVSLTTNTSGQVVPMFNFLSSYGLDSQTHKPWSYSDFNSRWNMKIGFHYSF